MVDLRGLGDKAKDFLNTEQGEKTSDAALARAAAVAKKVAGEKHHDKIESAREAADRRLGEDENPRR